MTSHGQNLKAFYAWTDVIGLQPGDRYLIVNPFFHAFVIKQMAFVDYAGVTIVPHPVFDANQVLKRIGEERITMLPAAIFVSNHFGQSRFKEARLKHTARVTGAASIQISF